MSDLEDEAGVDYGKLNKKEFKKKMRQQEKQRNKTQLESSKGWNRIDLGSDLLMCGTEGGFVSLEELEDGEDGNLEFIGMTENVDSESGGAGSNAGKNKKKKRKRKSKNKKKEGESKSDTDEVDTPKEEQAKKKPGNAKAAVDISAWKAFNLHPGLERGISTLGFREPTPIQLECLPAAVLKGLDIIGAAETGSGKTLAFGLPILNHLIKEAEASMTGQDPPDFSNDSNVNEKDIEVEDLEEEEEEEDPHQGEGSSENEDEEGGNRVEEDMDAGMDEDEDEDEGQVEELEGETDLSALHRLRALIIAPTRELALQVHAHLVKVTQHTAIKVVPIVGGISQQKQRRMLQGKPEVVVATPGRLWDYMEQGEDHLTHLANLSFLVIDEADRMVEKGHFAELENILSRLPPLENSTKQKKQKKAEKSAKARRNKKQKTETQVAEEEEEAADEAARMSVWRQTFVFSATLALPPELKAKLRKHKSIQLPKKGKQKSMLEVLMSQVEFRGRPQIVDLTSTHVVAHNLSESAITCTEATRDMMMYYLLNRHSGRSIVFCNAISALRRASALLRHLGVAVVSLHASMQQRARLKALERFTRGEATCMVATDVAARGLDIPGVRCVIHYQLATTADIYVHRSGRTARAGKDGLSVALVVPQERARYVAQCRAMGREDGLPDFPVEAGYLPALQRRLKLAQQLDSLTSTQSKDKAQKTWRQRAAEALDMVEESSSEDEAEEMEASRANKKQKAALQAAQQAMAKELSKPLLPEGGSLQGKFLKQGDQLTIQQAAGAGNELSKVEALEAFSTSSSADAKPTFALKQKPKPKPQPGKTQENKKAGKVGKNLGKRKRAKK